MGFFLRVDDFDAAHAKMTADGFEFVTDPRAEPHGRVAVFRDIAGNRWDLLGAGLTRFPARVLPRRSPAQFLSRWIPVPGSGPRRSRRPYSRGPTGGYRGKSPQITQKPSAQGAHGAGAGLGRGGAACSAGGA